MTITLTYIDCVCLNICADYKEGLFTSADTQTFALTDSVEVCTIVLANLLTVTNSLAIWASHALKSRVCSIAFKFGP